MSNNRKLQIGVIGSMADLKYSAELAKLAEEVGLEIARRGVVLMFGAEKDADSLSTAACRGAKRGGGLTVGVTYGKGLEIYEKKYVDVVITSGSERGGGRELVLALSCDVIICLAGGSGTLTEMAIAYQAGIPVVVLENTGGWSEKLAGQFLDARERVKFVSAKTPVDAVNLAVSLARRTLFVGAIHGNETIGLEVLQRLEQERIISSGDWLIGNTEALSQKKRYLEADLNRIFPGNSYGKLYEERRAQEILAQARPYRFVVDIHGTDDETGVFIIVSNPTLENLSLVEKFDVANMVIWESASARVTGPLNQFVKCGIEIECCPQKSETVHGELERVLKKYCLGGIAERPKQYFEVYGKLLDYTGDQEIKSFQEVTVAGETFFPLLVDRYPGIKCYKMRKFRQTR